MTRIDPNATPEELRSEATAADQRATESFDRCDTDGFVSQWAAGLTAQQLRLEAEIREQGGQMEFPALFDLQGARVPAVLCHIADRFKGYGTRSVWRIEDPETGRAVAWVTAWLTEKNMAKKGYRQGTELAPARAVLHGTGRGLSGSCSVIAQRLDGGYPGRKQQD